MLIIKDGVIGYCKSGCVRPPVWDCITVASDIFDNINKDCVVTSLCEGRHSKNSKHYEGNAVDFRSRHLSKEQLEQVVNELENKLSADYDVIVESTHIHVEYDPK